MRHALKFCMVGAVGLTVNLSVFHALYVLGIPYLLGSAAALSVSMVVGFLLQKYWTFSDRAHAGVAHVQFVQYAGLALCNLLLNSGIVYLLIGKLGVFHLFAQAIGAGIVALDSFIVYRTFIFRHREREVAAPAD